MTRRAGRPAAPAALIAFLILGAPPPASAAEPDLARACARYAADGVREAECTAQLQIARHATAKYRDPASRAVIVKQLRRGRYRARAAKRGMRNGGASIRVLP